MVYLIYNRHESFAKLFSEVGQVNPVNAFVFGIRNPDYNIPQFKGSYSPGYQRFIQVARISQVRLGKALLVPETHQNHPLLNGNILTRGAKTVR